MPLFFRKTRRQLDEQRWELNQRERELESQADRLDEERLALDDKESRLQLLIVNRVDAFPHIAQAWADWELALAQKDATFLRRKKHPARSAAEAVKEKGREMAELRRKMKLAEYVVALYEFHFPWLTDLRDLDAELDYAARGGDGPHPEDPVSTFLSKEEWAALSPMQRNQRALDRYLKSKLTPWQLGRDYERYIGYLREQAGCTVTYHGIIRGFEDLGRDVLAEKNGSVEVIQCKRWAQHKLIHEKHIFQLFGTLVAAQIENPQKTITGTFTTTTRLSERARQFANALGIRVEESFPLSEYPRIKCNIARRTGERIYHLPFDQQYDSTVIEPSRGEIYANTCAEAEALGFRRAWRWRGPRDG